MKPCTLYRLVTLLIVLLSDQVSAQTTAFMYQGRLTVGSDAANGLYDLEFRLWDETNRIVATASAMEDVNVTNGLLTVLLDFGDGR